MLAFAYKETVFAYENSFDKTTQQLFGWGSSLHARIDATVQAYDLLMLIILAMATIFGAIKGFAWQVASLASIVVSYLVAYRFRFEVAEMIQAQPPWNQFLAMLILYVGTSFVIWVGFRLFSGLIDRVRLKEFDRHLGAGFGLAKGLIFCLLITMFAMSLLGPNQQAAICRSRSGYYIAQALDHGMGILPKEIHDVVGPYLASLDEKLNHGGAGTGDPSSQVPNSGTGPATSGTGTESGLAWPFDSANLNQQLQNMQIPSRLTEFLPDAPTGLPTGNSNLQPSGGTQLLPNSQQFPTGVMPPPNGQSFDPGSGQSFGGGQATGAFPPQDNFPPVEFPSGGQNNFPPVGFPSGGQTQSSPQQAQQPSYVLPR